MQFDEPSSTWSIAYNWPQGERKCIGLATLPRRPKSNERPSPIAPICLVRSVEGRSRSLISLEESFQGGDGAPIAWPSRLSYLGTAPPEFDEDRFVICEHRRYADHSTYLHGSFWPDSSPFFDGLRKRHRRFWRQDQWEFSMASEQRYNPLHAPNSEKYRAAPCVTCPGITVRDAESWCNRYCHICC